jgi:hypothetical protein
VEYASDAATESRVWVHGFAVEAIGTFDLLGVRPGRMGLGWAAPVRVNAEQAPAPYRVYLTYLHAI